MPRNQVVPASAENQVAGKPFALPTATWLLPLAMMLFTASSGSTAPGMAARLTGLTCPAWSTVSSGCWPCSVAEDPVATTAPPAVVARPAMVPAAALDRIPALCQEAPVALVNASTAPPPAAAITAPAGPPPTLRTVSAAWSGPVMVAPNFQVRPSGEVKATAAARPWA